MASVTVSLNFAALATSGMRRGSPSSRRARATARPSAVWGSMSPPVAAWTRRMAASRSACVEVPETNPNSSAMRSRCADRSSLPVRSSSDHASAKAPGPRRVRMNRSRLEAFEMSMDGLDVARVASRGRGAYTPVRKNSSRTLFSFVARMRRRMGTPMLRARCPA